MNEVGPTTSRVPAALPSLRDGSDVRGFVEAAFDAHESEVYGLCLAVARDPELAADVTQEAFLRLLAEARAGRHPDNVGAWLHRTASNLIISRARRNAVARRLAPRLISGNAPETPEGAALEHERSAVLRAALAELPPEHRVALVLAAQGLSGEEIAARLGKRHGAARALLWRARNRLRAAVARRESAA